RGAPLRVTAGEAGKAAAAVGAPVPALGPVPGGLDAPPEPPADLLRQPPRRLAGDAVLAGLVHLDLCALHLRERLLPQAGAGENGGEEPAVVAGGRVEAPPRGRLRGGGPPAGGPPP